MQAHDNSQSALRLDAQNATAYWFTSRCDRVWAIELNTNAPRKYVNNDNLRGTGWRKYLIMYICIYLYLYRNTYLYISMHIYLYIGIYKKTQLYIDSTLQWRHNGCDSVSNHQPLLNRLFRRRSKKHQSSASLAFVPGFHRGPVNSPHKWPVTRKMFPFHDVIMNTTNQWINIILQHNCCKIHPNWFQLWDYQIHIQIKPKYLYNIKESCYPSQVRPGCSSSLATPYSLWDVLFTLLSSITVQSLVFIQTQPDKYQVCLCRKLNCEDVSQNL